jgi:tetratricopeptide (TPR) repeat protein
MTQATQTAALLAQAEQLRLAGKLGQAEAACRQVLQSHPGAAGAWQTLALIAHQVGNAARAAELMARAVAAEPAAVGYRRNLCEMLRRLGRLPEAIDQGREAVRLAPDDPVARYNLGIALDDHGDLEGARAQFARAVALDPNHNLAWNNLGSTRNRLGDEDGALDAYLRAAEIDPRHAEAQNNAGAIYIERGELDLARARFRLAIDARPDFLEAHQNLSTLIRYTPDDPHYAFLETELVRRNALDGEQRLRLLFAVGKAREDVGHHQLALIAFHEANRLKRAALTHDEPRAERLLAALTRPFGAEGFPTAVDGVDPTPVFILGMPRSGTTLLEQVLASHPQVHGAGELKDFHAALRAHPKVGDMADAPSWVPALTDDAYREIGAAYSSACAPTMPARAHHRQDARQLSLPGLHSARPARGAHHPQHARPDGLVLVQLHAALQRHHGVRLRPRRARSPLQPLPRLHAPLAGGGPARAHLAPALRTDGGRYGGRGASGDRPHRAALGRRLPALSREPPQGAHRERGAGARAYLSQLRRPLGRLRRRPCPAARHRRR